MTSREKFEAWMTAEQWFHGSDFEWDERRNCYAQFGIHLAYKAFLAAEVAAEQKLTDMEVQLANAESKCRELAAENTELKSDRDTLARYWIEGGGDEECANSYCEQTPATDAFLAEMRASARNEGINYAASRLAAAFNHGFVDKPLTEVCDVVRMILDTKEELANSTLPAADGLSGEYAEEFLEDIAAQLRKGAEL